MTTPLRQEMIEDMQLRSLSEITQERYIAAMRLHPGQKLLDSQTRPVEQAIDQAYNLLVVRVWRTHCPSNPTEMSVNYDGDGGKSYVTFITIAECRSTGND